MDEILDVDLLAFESGGDSQRKAVIDGVMRSLRTGFVYTSHDIGEDLLDTTYAMLAEFFEAEREVKDRFVAPGSHGQTGYTGLLVETAAVSDAPDWKEMLNWGQSLPGGHPLRDKYEHRYGDQMIPEAVVPGIVDVLMEFHRRTLDIQRRFLRIVALGVGAAEDFFEGMLTDGTTLTRAIRYPPMAEAPDASGTDRPHVWAAEHGDINLTTALPRATARGLQVRVGEEAEDEWVDASPPSDHVIINTGIMLERLTNGIIPIGWHRVVADPDQPGERYSVVQFCHPTPWTILSPIHSSVTADNPQRFAGIEAGDLLDQVIYDINLVEDSRRVDN
ncbi:MAG: isopenicillin N synthase family oxygenase [Actinomycetia bacterium]|nr:isopenicillin N synthase family oxygenase [Actinomycetes bacterium]